MTSASSIGVDVDVTDTSSLLIELGCACDYIHYFAARESTQRGRQGHVRHTSPFFDFGRRLLRVSFEAAVECNDPAHEIAVLHRAEERRVGKAWRALRAAGAEKERDGRSVEPA